jgi:N-acetylmuramic acid 6-phosphate etherase
MKAGTAQKMILNMISTATMIRLGWVYSNLMSNLRVTNDKLRRRACAILSQETGLSDEAAARTFHATGEDLRIALLMAHVNLSREDAQRLLDSHAGSVRSALDSVRSA